MVEMNVSEFVNINKISDMSFTEVQRRVSCVIAKDTLAYINEHDAPVHPKNTFYTRYGKRIFDVMISLVALIVTLPVNLILAICTFFDVGRPIFFKQERLGKDGKVFKIVKFRNMTNEKDENGDLLPASKRVTRFGAFVRKTSLDELLNFWYIFKGDMSFIGPRPLPVAYKRRFSDRHNMRTVVRPGLECPILKVEGRGSAWDAQLENDIWYVENVSFALDVKLALSLVKMVFDRKSGALRGAATRGSFMGYYSDGTSINSRSVPKEYYDQAMGMELADVW